MVSLQIPRRLQDVGIEHKVRGGVSSREIIQGPAQPPHFPTLVAIRSLRPQLSAQGPAGFTIWSNGQRTRQPLPDAGAESPTSGTEPSAAPEHLESGMILVL